jgi:hypothetical protein
MDPAELRRQVFCTIHPSTMRATLVVSGSGTRCPGPTSR